MHNNRQQIPAPRTKKSLLFSAIAVVVSFLLPGTEIAAEELPLFEMGMGLGGIHQPYYTGSKQNRDYVFPVPLPVYRGKFVKSDSRGVRAEVVDEERVKLDISVDFNLAFDSDDVDLREGMDDIDNMLQVGPSLQFLLMRGENNKIKLHLPVRLNLGVSLNDISDDGITFSPGLSYHHRFQFMDTPWTANLAVIPQFGTDQYHDVYYGVAQRFATETRAQYETESGYSGYRLTFSLRSRDRNRLLVWFMRYDNIDGAVFEDSPMVETNHGVSFGFIYSRFFYRSKTMVSVSD